MEGVLSKYTNAFKGWQHRYFILDADSGMLEYFEVRRLSTYIFRQKLCILSIFCTESCYCIIMCPSDLVQTNVSKSEYRNVLFYDHFQSYFTQKEEQKKQRPRGCIHLAVSIL